MRLILGLGNPGAEYHETRHNIGFMVLDRMALRWGVSLAKNKFDAEIGTGMFQGERLVLAKPQTYMNRSGFAASRIASFYKIDREDCIVVYDDIDLPFGTIRIKEKGGTGGHKGVKSIMESLGGGDFIRLRLGVGRPETKRTVTDHVLGRFGKDEEFHLASFLDMSGDALESILRSGVLEGMNRYNNKQIVV